jgi:hypothetical protein
MTDDLSPDARIYFELFSENTYTVAIPREEAKELEEKGLVTWVPPVFGEVSYTLTDEGRRPRGFDKEAKVTGDKELSDAYVRLRNIIPGAHDTPFAPSPEVVWAITEKAAKALVERAEAAEAELARTREGVREYLETTGFNAAPTPARERLRQLVGEE